MTDWNERIEHLINRKLDGELTEEERLELDRALIRSPAHRRMLEQSQRIDAACPGVLRELVQAGSAEYEFVEPSPISRPPRFQRAWWLVPAAMAACVGWLVVMEPSDISGTVERSSFPARSFVEQNPLVFPPSTVPGVGSTGYLRPVSMRQGITDGRRDTSVFGVIGDDGNVYLIEVDRLQTYHRPAPRALAPSPFGEL